MPVDSINNTLVNTIYSLAQILPHLKRLHQSKIIFEHDFGLSELPTEARVLTIRGPRQFGKSTWLEADLLKNYQAFEAGSSFYLNEKEFLLMKLQQ